MSVPFLYVALDGLIDDEWDTLAVARELTLVGGAFGFKVNVDYVLERGQAAAVNTAKALNRRVFIDIKAWNGSRTMRDLVRKLIDLGVDEVTLHAIAGPELAKAAAVAEKAGLRILANTLLTHYDEAYCQRVFRRDRRDTVRMLAEIAKQYGCQGITLPGQYLADVADLGLVRCVPAIRPAGGQSDGRHATETTPEQARERGAEIVVCGSPIMKAEDPVAALRGVLHSLGHDVT